MWLMWTVGGLVIGLLIFLMLRRRVKQDEKRLELKGVVLTCPGCEKAFDAEAAFKRSGLRGDLFVCPQCTSRVWA
jgi:hypothetical protein